MLKKINIIIYFLLYCYNLTAQDLSFSTLTTEQGLPSNEVYSLLTDKKGYIWGATDGGVFRYNGEQFKIYTTKNGLPDNTILNIYEDAIGKIWMTGFNGKVAYIDNDKITSIAANDSLSKLLQTAIIFSIQVSTDGTLWLGTNTKLIKISPKNNYQKMEVVKVKNAGLVIKEVERFKPVISKQSNPKIDFKNIDVSIERKSQAPFNFNINFLGSSSPAFRCRVLFDSTILFNQDNSLFLINENNKVQAIKMESTVSSIYETKEGVWICTLKNGVYFFENSNFDIPPKNYLNGYSIISITKDEENGMWFGTLGKGIIYCPSINYLKMTNNVGLDDKIVALHNFESNIYAMSENNILYQISTEYTNRILYKPSKSTLTDQAQIISNNGNLIFGAISGGSFNLQNKNFSPFIIDEKTPVGGTGITKIADTFYLLAFSNLLMIKNNEVFKKYSIPSRGRCISSDKKGNIYLGTLSGLYLFDNEKFNFIQDSLLNTRINNILPVDDYLILSTSGSGLLVYSLLSKKTIQINSEKGLIDDICTYANIKDNEVWVGTKKGISRIVFKNNEFKEYTIINYDVSNGLISNEINNIDFRGDEVWIGTRKGLCFIKDYKNAINTYAPKVYLESFEVNNVSTEIFFDKTNDLIYSENNFTFHLASLSYKNSTNNKYFLKLEGYDNNFKYTSNSTIEYQNLPYGNYTFIAYGLNNNGVKSEKPITVNFYISPPLWKTWWFILFVVLISILFIALVFYYRLKYFRKKEKEKNDIRISIAELESKALRAQMNPHFVFNAINAIQSFILKNDSKLAYDYLSQFSRLIRMVLDNSRHSKISLKKEVETLNLYIELEKIRFEIPFKHSIEVDKFLLEEDIYIPTMLLQPFVENAIRHGLMPKQNGAELTIKINLVDEKLNIQIIDNGIGRKASGFEKVDKTHQSLGVSITEDRFNILKKQVGSDVTLIVEDLFDSSGNVLGTKVEITLPL